MSQDPKFDVFLSHNSNDKPVVTKIKQILESRRVSCWLDKDELTPGSPWQRLIEAGIKQSESVAVCFGPAGIGPWEDEEMQAALIWAVKHGKRVIPVILPDAPEEPEIPIFLGNRTWVNLRTGLYKDNIDTLVWGITGNKPGAAPQFPSWPGNPYRSLEPFRQEHALIFFGRAQETEELLNRFRNGQRVLAVVGASGSGKSSLVGAGLLARLAENAVPGSQNWVVIRFTPAEEAGNPFRALATQLWPLLTPIKTISNVENLAYSLVNDPSKIKDYAVDVLKNKPGADLLLFVDQFEELFTDRVPETWRAPFARLIAVIADSRQLRLVLTLRADFYDNCLKFYDLKVVLKDCVFPLFSPDDFTLKEMIEDPARLAGIELDKDFTKKLLKEVGQEDGRLALLEFTLARLYKLGGGKRLSLDDCKVAEAIEIQGNNALAEAGHVDETVLWDVFNALADVDEKGSVVRLRAWQDAFSPAQQSLLQNLVKARLLTADRDQSGRSWVEVAHEKVLSAWTRYADWLELHREFKRWRKRLAVYIKDGEFLRGKVLLEAEDMLSKWKTKLEPDERKFISESQTIREQDRAIKEKQKFNEKWLRRLNIALICIGIALTSISAFGIWVYVNEVTWTLGSRALTTRIQCWIGQEPDWLPKMKKLKGGTYPRGSTDAEIKAGQAYQDEGPQRLVTIKPFRLGIYEITLYQYSKFANNRSYQCKKHPDSHAVIYDQGMGREDHPAINVSWQDAQCYAEWLSFVTGRDYRLPTEAEWEYAARAGSTGAYYWENGDMGKFAWFSDNSGGHTHPVGTKDPNAFGLYDMSGNVWEWMQDGYQGNYQDVPINGTAWEPKEQDVNARRMLRGGAWGDKPDVLRSANRGMSDPDIRPDDAGFRLAQD